jgi:hypothetical protein
MKTICRFAYTAVLALSTLNFAPSLASAQDAAGTFTLAHEVHWLNAVVPPGKYRFTLGADSRSELLTLRKVSGGGAGFILLVTDADSSQPSDVSRLVLVSRPSGTFVSTMQLPEFGMTLHFAVPNKTREVPQTNTATIASTAH